MKSLVLFQASLLMLDIAKVKMVVQIGRVCGGAALSQRGCTCSRLWGLLRVRTTNEVSTLFL